jgi:hypothetical protein
LLRKFLVRDPTKRATLNIVKDDAWINETYTESPITENIGPDVIHDPDEEILRFITDKFSVPRDQIVNCLQENAYDDITAIYLLLADQKQNGKWTPYQPGVSPMSPVQLQQGTVTPASKAPQMATIGEDGKLRLFTDCIHHSVRRCCQLAGTNSGIRPKLASSCTACSRPCCLARVTASTPSNLGGQRHPSPETHGRVCKTKFGYPTTRLRPGGEWSEFWIGSQLDVTIGYRDEDQWIDDIHIIIIGEWASTWWYRSETTC